ncbi:MAG: PIN domain-containing protein [Gammaproteobacteria bacterium]|nr:PIN domain-containing protein [Gammaproteobacteria bacterium]
MNVESFIDTNVFVYQLERIDIRKANIADELIEYGIQSQSACISHQVIQECVNTAVRKAEIPLTGDEMRKYIVDVLAPMYRIRPDIPLYLKSLDIQARYRFSFYDSLIVAAALTAGCRTLYTEDLSDNQQIEDMTIVNPFSSKLSDRPN